MIFKARSRFIALTPTPRIFTLLTRSSSGFIQGVLSRNFFLFGGQNLGDISPGSFIEFIFTNTS
jgi:hypothetical protein